jgi:hypothetical protein
MTGIGSSSSGMTMTRNPRPGGTFASAGGMTMHHYEKRLRHLEARRRRRTIVAMAADVGLTAEELLEEAGAFFALSLEAQLAEVDEIAAALQAHGLSMDDVDDLKATLTREYRP